MTPDRMNANGCIDCGPLDAIRLLRGLEWRIDARRVQRAETR